MKKLLVLLAMICACSGEGYEEEAEFGEVAQSLTAQATPTLSYGFTTSSTKPNCNRTSSGQACLVPRTANKAIRWCVTNGQIVSGNPMPPTDVSRIARVRTEMQRAITDAMAKFGWTFTHLPDDSVASPDACMTNSTSNVLISLGTTGLCGSATGANIENYVCMNPSGIIGPLTESLPGTYSSFDGSVILVDFTDAVNKAVNAADTDKLLFHGLGHTMLSTVGIGSQTAASNLLSRRAVLPYSNTLGTSSSENCRALGYNVSSVSTFGLHTVLGCPD